MKKVITIFLGITILMSSCATLTNKGPVTTYQRTKPKQGEPARQVRAGALVCDILFFGLIGLAVDFGTHAIYKKDGNTQPSATPAKN